MFLAFIVYWTLIIGMSALSGLCVGLLLRQMPAPAAKWKEVALGLLLSASLVAVAFYALTGGLRFEAQAYGPTWRETVAVVAVTAPVWVGTFLLTRKSKR